MTRSQVLVEKNKRRAQIRRELQAWMFCLILFAIAMLPVAAVRHHEKEVITIDTSSSSGDYTSTKGQRYHVELIQAEE